MTNFAKVNPKQSFPKLESEVLKYWKENNTFQKSIDSRSEDNPYRFYDGPPFITGTPHYGSLLSSVVKDVVGRYWTMRGRRVERVWGWDCHGLPIEEKVQKKLGLASSKDIEENGVKEFIDGCYEYTKETSAEWGWYIDKIGRWVDMDKAYRTMDQDYIESVMWVFKQLWDKGLIYEGKRVSLYSWKLSTPISNFEVAMDDTYQEVNDPAITVKFELTQNTKETDKNEGGEFEYTDDGYLRYVLAVIKNEKGEYLMLKNKKHGGKWQCPGGKIDAGENAETALKREIMEELAVDCEVKNHLCDSKIYAKGTLWQGEYYEVELAGTPKICEPHKHEKIEWVSLAQDEEKTEMKCETECYDDMCFIRENYDFFNLTCDRDAISKISILAWTTTPWTIPAHLMLAVGKNIDYVLVSHDGEGYIVAKSRLETVFKGKGEYKIIREMKGSELEGMNYIPPFPEYYHHKYPGTHEVYIADFATDSDGTGIVHCAPEFGDVDFALAKEKGIRITEAMDEAGKYTKEIFDMKGVHYLDANKINTERMKENGTLFKNESITHRIPFCPRSGTPLVQKAQSSWFVDIQSQKDKLIEANEQINWFPKYLKHGRFKKGIESAPDWCISRTRYWGAPMPIWQNNDGSIREIYADRDKIFEANAPYGQLKKEVHNEKNRYFFSGGSFDGTPLNLHRPYIDSILVKNPDAKISKKVLGVHGWRDDGLENPSTIWSRITNELKTSDVELDVPIFDQSEETSYSNWKEHFDNLDLTQYDTIIAHSLGCPMVIKYLVSNPTHVNRLVLVAPSGIKGNLKLENLIDTLSCDERKLLDFVEEITVIHSKDDEAESAPFTYGAKLAKKLKAEFIALDGYGHAFRNGGEQILAGILTDGTPLQRASEVLDVWMDSGSMPYAQMHYPFDNKKAMEASFPADFIAEYVGQIRAWFYVMHVLGVLVGSSLGKENLTQKNPPVAKATSPFKKGVNPAFTNVITTGVINGNDGRKMSKSFGNYPDPRKTIEQHGADPIRFYMLNSPLLSGGDMDFKEEGIVETVKNMTLPLWNTYSFFTTYANIDKWEKDTTEVWFSRHGESTANVAMKMSDGKDDAELTEKGREQAKNAGKKLAEQGVQFDVIVHTDRIRAKDTAEIIAKEVNFDGEFVVEDGFAEQTAGEYANKTTEEMREIAGLSEDCDSKDLRKAYKNNSVENMEQFEKRVLETYEKVLEKYKSKKILIVAHAGTPRPMMAKYNGMDTEKAYYDTDIRNADPFELMTTPIINPLDKWILSRLQILIGKTHDAFEGYDISRACRGIVEFMDDLTNWYIRLSRRRFWGSNMSTDKLSAYETLYRTLKETSKLLAPLMPFLAENIYKGLTDALSKNPEDNSVHLQYISYPNTSLIQSDLNRDMKIANDVVSIGLALRSRKNIRVRQPLGILTITNNLDDYYQNIIQNELNVKEIKIVDPEMLATKICKPDARKLGPKYGKEVQSIIREGKSGNFEELENGKLQILDYTLESDEYTIEYLPKEGVGDVEGANGQVIGLDTEITEELKIEGFARDIIRQIQDMRKTADYQITDTIEISLDGNIVANIRDTFGKLIENETLGKIVEDITSADEEKTLILDDENTVKIKIGKR